MFAVDSRGSRKPLATPGLRASHVHHNDQIVWTLFESELLSVFRRETHLYAHGQTTAIDAMLPFSETCPATGSRNGDMVLAHQGPFKNAGMNTCTRHLYVNKTSTRTVRSELGGRRK